MEKAALLAGGVVLIAYTLGGTTTDKGDNNNSTHPGLTRLQPPGRHLLPPPIDNTTPGLQKLHAQNRRLLPTPQPADPIGLVPLAAQRLQPLAPRKLQPADHKKNGEPISVTHGEARCMRLADNTAWYNYPTPSTIDACYDLLVTIPCPASKCAMYWDGKPIQ
jgi:hypothetical protein